MGSARVRWAAARCGLGGRGGMVMSGPITHGDGPFDHEGGQDETTNTLRNSLSGRDGIPSCLHT